MESCWNEIVSLGYYVGIGVLRDGVVTSEQDSFVQVLFLDVIYKYNRIHSRMFFQEMRPWYIAFTQIAGRRCLSSLSLSHSDDMCLRSSSGLMIVQFCLYRDYGPID